MLNIVIIIIAILNLLAMISIIFIEKKNPTSALAWVIVLNILPIIGFVFYFFLGSSEKLKLNRKIYKLDVVEEKIIKCIKRNNVISDDVCDLFRMNDVSYLNSVSSDNDVLLFNDMNEAMSAVFEDMLGAKESIHVSFFIFNTRSDIGKKFIDILSIKVKEGVKVRFTYDRLGCMSSRYSDFSEIISNGGEVYKHLPSFVKTLVQCNYRNHRKMIVIDSRVAYTGGMNISDEYLGSNWRDTFVRVTGGCVDFIQGRFFIDFVYLKKLSLKRKYNEEETERDISKVFCGNRGNGSDLVQFVFNGPDTRYSYIRDGYLKMINMARSSLYIQTPYFIPDESILDALRISSASGVDISIMIPGKPDKKGVYYVTLSFVERLIEYGIKVYVYDGFIHSKVLICDGDYISIGSCNFDSRSFRLNYEGNIFINSSKLASKGISDFNEDMARSKVMSKVYVGWFRKFVGLICRLFSPLL